MTPKLINYKAHIWYEGTSHRYTSPGTKVKVISKGQVKYQGHISQKMGVSGAFVFHKHIFFLNTSTLEKEALNLLHLAHNFIHPSKTGRFMAS